MRVGECNFTDFEKNFMKQEDLRKILIEFAEFLEQYGNFNITDGIEMYADEFARRQVKLFCQPAVIKSVCRCKKGFKEHEVDSRKCDTCNRDIY
jgi:hypothetical protein